MGGRRTASVLHGVLPARRRRQRRDRKGRDRDGRGLRRDDEAPWRHDHPPRDRQRADGRGGHPAGVGGAQIVRAVIFDLWETLIDWDHDANALMHSRVRERVGFDFHERWNRASERYTTPVRTVLAGVGVPADAMEDVLSYRAEFVRTCLVPREGAVETLEELRARGLKIGLITVCTEDVELLWPESA